MSFKSFKCLRTVYLSVVIAAEGKKVGKKERKKALILTIWSLACL